MPDHVFYPESIKLFYQEALYWTRFASIVGIATSIFRAVAFRTVRQSLEKNTQRTFLYLGAFIRYVELLSLYTITNLFYQNIYNDKFLTFKEDIDITDLISNNNNNFVLLQTLGILFEFIGNSYKPVTTFDDISKLSQKTNLVQYKEFWISIGVVCYTLFAKLVAHSDATWLLPVYISWGVFGIINSFLFADNIGLNNSTIFKLAPIIQSIGVILTQFRQQYLVDLLEENEFLLYKETGLLANANNGFSDDNPEDLRNNVNEFKLDKLKLRKSRVFLRLIKIYVFEVGMLVLQDFNIIFGKKSNINQN